MKHKLEKDLKIYKLVETSQIMRQEQGQDLTDTQIEKNIEWAQDQIRIRNKRHDKRCNLLFNTFDIHKLKQEKQLADTKARQEAAAAA
jgi:hypothetical protein